MITKNNDLPKIVLLNFTKIFEYDYLSYNNVNNSNNKYNEDHFKNKCVEIYIKG